MNVQYSKYRFDQIKVQIYFFGLMIIKIKNLLNHSKSVLCNPHTKCIHTKYLYKYKKIQAILIIY